MLQAQVRVHADRIIGTIDPRIYGHFIEHMGRCVYGGFWAEMLANRKFAGPGQAGLSSPWEAIGTSAVCSHDETMLYGGAPAQRIAARGAHTIHGVSQGQLALQASGRYRARLVARQEGLSGLLRVELGDKEGRSCAAAELACPVNDWGTLEAELTAPVDDAQGRLTISFRGAGTLWLGAASLMPAGTVAGWRADVLAAAKELHPTQIRWPGGNFASAYHWRDGVGPRDRRPARPDPAWHALEPNDVGTDEFMQLCRELGAEPYLCVNVGDGTPEEAAAWVEYCNGHVDTPMGRLRAKNGHPDPYRVRLLGVGNETYGYWQHGHCDAETYARRCLAFARAMRAVDPAIELVGVGAQAYEAPGWNDTVLCLAGDSVDLFSLHHYAPGYGPDELPLSHRPYHQALYPTVVAAPERVEELLAEAEGAIARHGNAGRMRIALDEWNTWVHPHYECAEPAPYLLRDGLYAAGMYNVMHRRCRTVSLANLAQMVNVLGAIYTTPTGLFTTPVYLANRLYAERSGGLSVATETASPTFAAPAEAFLPARDHAAYHDAQATLAEDRRTLYLSVVNRHPQEAITVDIDIRGAEIGPEGQGAQLHGTHALAGNSAENPENVHLRELPPFVAGSRFRYTFPAHSATVLELPAAAIGAR